MLSLRARLTISYAVLLGLFLTIIGFFAACYITELFLHPIAEEMEFSAVRVRSVAAEHPLADQDLLERLIDRHPSRPEVALRFYPSTMVANDHHSVPWTLFFGLRRIRIPTRHGFVDIVPNVDALTPILRSLLGIYGAMLTAIIAISWLCARVLTVEAIRPLYIVTSELRRFAGGDFTPRALEKIYHGEFGELTEAYNAAASQVGAAFEEHVRVEEQMKRFVADASHELRTPLTVISGYIDILRRMDPADLAGHERAFQTLNVETKRVRLLVERLVALARLERTERAQREVIDIRTVVNEVVLEVTAVRDVTIELNVVEEFQIVADLADVYDAIRNLLENAVKYGENSPISIKLSAVGQFGCVCVRDEGPGIPEHERAHLFERFFRGERRANIEGSGLGLSIVARAMQRSNGTVTLESAKAGDTRFLLCFPRYVEERPL